MALGLRHYERCRQARGEGGFGKPLPPDLLKIVRLAAVDERADVFNVVSRFVRTESYFNYRVCADREPRPRNGRYPAPSASCPDSDNV